MERVGKKRKRMENDRERWKRVEKVGKSMKRREKDGKGRLDEKGEKGADKG